MAFFNKYIALVLLIIISILLLFIHNTGFYKTLNIPLDDSYPIIGISDAVQGGESTIEVEKNEDSVTFKCDIIAAYQWPYCEIKIHLAPIDKPGVYKHQQGLDLSEYDEVFLDISYKGPKPERLRFYIRNYNPAYSNLESDDNSMKINEIEFEPNSFPSGEYVQLRDFNVASWWSGMRNIPPEFQGREFTNVPLLEIATAGLVEFGEMQATVNEITFRRLYISKENLLFTIIAMWLSSALIYLIAKIGLYRYHFKKAKASQARLLEIMHALKLEKSEIEKMSKRDSLTGLRNRAGLSNHFSECSNQLTTNQVPFSIVFIDIDFFKKINDVHGHNRGDDILVAFAQTIHSNIRIADRLGRWGGEEFILICKNSNLARAVATAEKLCAIIESQTFPGDLKITASFGVAEMKEGEATTAFIDRADQALYQAKSNGRNQVQASD
ncbi:hypothetical protein CW745_00490 [Psychromonas sp. psych-6C06]|uniref:GGDEF domain-containing protein n=1 Tax=Psychromonas sp. psych-6C06 TaxID=2058089 RepID=UPI000C32516D|nr:GGDEF domain-containing protein [Psychromonas sp. psych-6C06]PKF63368.1 hypothetical protein CW745_00490 [Psychromonas sp. psych-6C06]